MARDAVVITGCSSGIGHETARTFRERGWDVYATDPDPGELSDLEALGCEAVELDVTDDASVEGAVEHVVDDAGCVDCLVNNAGYGQIGPLEELPIDRLREQFEVNAFGPHRVTRAVLPSMRRRGGGTIVNVSSVYGRTAMIGQGAYCGSKFALEGMSDALRAEVANHGIDVVLIEPGPVETRFGETALRRKDDRERTGAYEWFDRLYSSRRTIDRAPGAIQPEDVASVIADAASDPNPGTRYRLGPYGKVLPLGVVVPTRVRDKAFSLLQRLL
ncbi:SDR family oxidoreductase [Halegenticoccus soli]|uniref:SDR family oxidoreductase n=1 Tax=Halegenticoccus soli TaxID=1985678 RepID=UPI000C6E6258|nr:SDR family oxidoreductase [Halegenticoccus soli]